MRISDWSSDVCCSDLRVPSYTASKSGVGGLTKLLANEWAAKGVQVNAIAPGYIATNNTAALQGDETRNRQILERIPAGRWGDPSDIRGAAVFLASSASDYVQGHILAVDGGRTEERRVGNEVVRTC